jgi:signal transduction histidine kinase/DNA-binding response OmpR family regulator
MKKKILVIDDNRALLNFMVNTLEQEGHQVLSARDGFEALDMLTDFTPDIIFIDLIIPKISGDRLCQIIRNMKNLDQCYLVIVSAVLAEMDFDYTKTGANACIAKGPFGKMAKHILAAVKESDFSKEEAKPKGIVGLDGLKSRQVTKELLSRNLHLEAILESINEGILEIFSERIIYANSTAISLFGIPQEKLLASYFIDLFDETLQDQVKPLLASEALIPTAVGLDKPLEINNRLVNIKSLPVQSDPLTTIILITDVTKQKQLEMQLQHVQKMEAIGTIASGVAHNFRNTLAGILANSQIILMNYKGERDLQEIAKRINTSVKHGSQMVERLMQFSRKQLKKEFQHLNLSAVVIETFQIIKESFDKKIEICIDVPEALPIIGDRLGLNQALMNLCTNSRDAMPNGGKLRVEAMQEGDMVILNVIDTGVGMDLETKEKCFDPFFTTKAVGRGTGLGLSTTYGIVQSHAGTIHVDSEPNKGTTFKLCFPLAVNGEQDKQEIPPRVVRGNGEKILIVDDEKEMQKAMSDLLEALCYRVEFAVNGEEAFGVYKTWRPDAVLMEINLPEMSGTECAEKIIHYDPAAKIVVVSGYEADDPNSLDEQKKKIIKGFLTKPIDMVELSFILAQLFNRDVS